MNIYLKTIFVIAFSLMLTFGLTNFVFESDRPQLKPRNAIIFERAISIVVGSKGEPVKEGVDPTPPPSIYY